MSDDVEKWRIDVCWYRRPWYWLGLKIKHDHLVLSKTCTWDEANATLRSLRERHPRLTITMISEDLLGP